MTTEVIDRSSTADWKLQFRLDRDLEILHLPTGLAQELGYECPETLLYYAGSSLLFSLHTEDIDSFRQFVEHASRDTAAERCFARLLTREGQFLWYLFSDCHICQEGEGLAAQCSCKNLGGEMMSLQEYLRKEENRLRHLREDLLHKDVVAGRPLIAGTLSAESTTDWGFPRGAIEGLPSGAMEQFVDPLPCGMLICEYWPDTAQMAVRFFNDTFSRLMGCSTGELRAFRGQQILTELIVEDDTDRLREAVKTMCTSGRPLNCEVRLRRTEAVQWVRVTGSVTNLEPEAFLIKLAFLDISNEKQSGKTLSFQNYCLERLNASLFFGIIVKRLGLQEKPIYMSTNIESFLKTLIPGIECANSLSYADLIHPADYPAVQEMALRCQREQLRSYELEFRLRMEDDSYRWIKIMGERLDDFGAEETYLLTFFDISSIKAAQEQLRIREEEYRIAVLHSKDIIVRLNLADCTIHVPWEVARRCHIPDKIENMPHALIDNGCIQPESISSYLAFYEQVQQGENSTVEICCRWFGNAIRWFRGVATVIVNEKQEPVSAILSFTDITNEKHMVSEMKTLEESEQMLEMIIGNSPRMILKYLFEVDRFVPISPSAKEIFARIPGQHDSETLLHARYIAQESLEDACSFFQGLCQGVPQNSVTIKVRAHDHGWRWYNCLYITSFSREQAPRYALLFCEDITRKRRQELASIRLRDYTRTGDREILFNLEYNLTLDTFEGSEGMIPRCYQSQFTVSYTCSSRRILEDVLPEYRDTFQFIFEKNNLIEALDRGRHSGALELQIFYEGEPLWVRIFYQMLRDPYTSFANIWISCINIHAEKMSELRLKEMAKLDPVTGIYNRAAFKDYVISRCNMAEDGLNRALIMLDIDGFGKVNDILGHLAGDQLLRDIADTLQMTIGKNDMVARIGGDEFAIYSSDFSDVIKAKERLRIMVNAVYRQISTGLNISISAGVAIYPRDGESFEELYRKADLALYHAKITGRNKYVIYNELPIP